MRYLLIVLSIFYINLFSQEIAAKHTYYVDGGVTDLVLKENFLYVSTNKSSISVFDTKTKKLKKNIKISTIKDFIGDDKSTKIYSIDVLNDKILFVSQTQNNYKNLTIFQDGNFLHIFTQKDKMDIKKAKYIDEENIVFALKNNYVILYNLKEEKTIWKTKVSRFDFSDFVLNKNKKFILIADKSKSLKQLDLKNGRLKKIYSGSNIDSIFQVDIKNNVIATAGQDRRCAIYDGFNQYYKKSNFMVHSVGLSPSGKLAAFQNKEHNALTVFNTKTKKELFNLNGHNTTLTKILFLNEQELFTSSTSNEVHYWQLN